jgi:hypothetical protein
VVAVSSSRHLRTGDLSLDPATSAIVDAIDQLTRSIVPTVDPPLHAEGGVLWALPNRVVVVLLELVDKAEAFGVLTVFVPERLASEGGYRRPIRSVADVDEGVAAAIRGRVANLPNAPATGRQRRSAPSIVYLLPLGHLWAVLDAIEYLALRAPRWQQLATLAIPVWFVIGSLVGGAASTLGRSLPHLDRSFGGLVGGFVGTAGWLASVAWLVRHVRATDEQRAAAFESMRRSTLAMGCLGTVVWLTGAVVLGAIIGDLLAAAGVTATVGSILLAGLLIAGFAGSVWTIRELRRRYPPPPQTRAERLVGRGLLVAMALVVGLVAWSVIDRKPTTVTAEQATWCLGPGAATLERSIATSPVERTWTAGTAGTDPNFASACKLAWDATH